MLASLLRTGLACVVTSLCAQTTICAQGEGSVGSNGLEPKISITSRTVGSPTEIRITGLVPQPGTSSLQLILSSNAGHVDLTPFGLPGAALGLDISGFSNANFTPLVIVPPSGQATFPFTPPLPLQGQTVYLQAVAFDPAAATAGIALSEARALTFGTGVRTTISSSGASPSNQALFRFFDDGAHVGPVLPALSGIEILDASLTATHDSLPTAADRPARDDTDVNRPRIVLADGSSLYRYRNALGRHGLFVISDGGREFHSIVEVAGVIEPCMAASPFEPFVAVTAPGAGPEFSGAELLLLRVDGENIAGTNRPVHPIVFSGATNGFEAETLSLTFLQGALICSDGTTLVRIPTDLSAPPAIVQLPPSGGIVPIDIDEEIAWSEDGSTAAFTAGATNVSRDVYVLQATGGIINLTQDAGDYDGVSYADIAEGGRLALSPDGSRIAYVKKETWGDLYVRDTTVGSPVFNLTDIASFGESLESEAAVQFASATAVMFTNGTEPETLDLYVGMVPLGGGIASVVNLTASSGFTSPPFGQGANLTLLGRSCLAGCGTVYRMNQGPGTPETVVLVPDTATPTNATVLPNVTNFVGSAGYTGGALVAVTTTSTSEVLRVEPSGSIAPAFAAAPGETVAAVIADRASSFAIAITTSGGQESLVLIPPTGPVVAVPGVQVTKLARSAAFLTSGAILISTDPSTGPVQTFHIDPSGAVVAMASPLPISFY